MGAFAALLFSSLLPQTFFHHSPTFFFFYLLSFYDFSRRSAEESDSSVFIYAFMQFWSDRRCSKEFFMSKISARAFSGGFRLFVLGRDRSSEGRDGWRGAGMEGGVERKNRTEKKLVAKKKRRKRNERTGSRII